MLDEDSAEQGEKIWLSKSHHVLIGRMMCAAAKKDRTNSTRSAKSKRILGAVSKISFTHNVQTN